MPRVTITLHLFNVARPATTQYVSVPLCLRKDTDGLGKHITLVFSFVVCVALQLSNLSRVGMSNDEAVLSEVMTNCSRTSA